MADLRLNVVIGGVQQSVSTLGEVEQALRETRAELEGVAIGSEAFKELTRQARNLQGQLEQVEKAINFEQSVNLLGESVGRLGATVASGFAVATSAIGLFAGESEELTEAQIKAQQALTLVLGATTIATNLSRVGQDLKNISDALGINLTRQKTKDTVSNTVATGVNTAAQGANAAATTAAATATRSFTAALAANPIGLIVVGITALVSALVFFGDETEESTEQTDRFTESLERLDGETNDYISTLREEYRVKIELAKLRGEEITAAALTIEELEKEADARQNQLTRIEGDLREYLEGREDLIEIFTADEKDTLDNFNIAVADATAVNLNLQNKLYDEFYQKQKEEDEKAYEARREALLNNTEQIVSILRNQLRLDPENTELKSLLQSYKNTSTEITKINNDITLEEERERQRRIENAKRERERIQKEREKITDDNKKALEDIRKAEEANALELRKLRIESGDERIIEDERVLGVKEALLSLELQTEKDVINEALTERIKEVESSKVLSKAKKDAIIADLNTANAAEIASLELLFTERRKAAKKEDDQLLLEAQERSTKLAEINRILLTETTINEQDAFNTFEALQIRREELEAERLARFVERQVNQQGVDLQQFEKAINDREKLLISSLNRREQIEIAALAKQNRLNLESLASQLEADFQLNSDFDTRVLGQVQAFTDEQARIERDALLERQETLTDEERAYLALLQTRVNQTEETAIRTNEITQQYADQRVQIENEADDQILAKRLEVVNGIFDNLKAATEALRTDVTESYFLALDTLQTGITTFLEIQDTEFATSFEKIAAYATAALQVVQGVIQAVTQANQQALQEELTEFERVKNEETDVLTRQLNQGLITREQYDAAIDKLDKDLQKKALAAKKKAFEEDKNLKIAQAIIAGLQGAVSAFAGAMQLGPVAGPIVGGILAAAVAALTGVQVAAIKKQKFDAGGVTESINPPTIEDPGNQLQQQVGSTGGFTQFNEGLTGTPPGGGTDMTGGQTGGMRVYVLESDITATQRRVEVAETTATFG